MRKVTMILAISISLTFLFIAGFPRSGDAQQIYGCYGKYGGLLRVVSAPTQCNKKLETPISWNAVGPPGAVGATGPAGPAGPQGPQGPAGGANGLSRVAYGIAGRGFMIYPNDQTITITQSSPGVYGFTFDPPFSSLPACVVSASGNPVAAIAMVEYIFDATYNILSVLTYDPATGQLVEPSVLAFICVQ